MPGPHSREEAGLDTLKATFGDSSDYYCISDSFVDHDGYSISSKGFLPTVVDIMVIRVKFTHSSPF